MNYKFRELSIGDTFDFISGTMDSFFERCKKISTRKYEDELGRTYCVGSIDTEVYHVCMYNGMTPEQYYNHCEAVEMMDREDCEPTEEEKKDIQEKEIMDEIKQLHSRLTQDELSREEYNKRLRPLLKRITDFYGSNPYEDQHL